jgi:hypothetical protein
MSWSINDDKDKVMDMASEGNGDGMCMSCLVEKNALFEPTGVDFEADQVDPRFPNQGVPLGGEEGPQSLVLGPDEYGEDRWGGGGGWVGGY